VSIATVVTRGYGTFGTIGRVVTRGYSAGAAAADDDIPGGYSYATPYQRMQSVRKESKEMRAAIDTAEADKVALEAKLEKATRSKAKKHAETQRKLELKLQRLDAEIVRLLSVLQTLEILIREWDEEDALIAIALSSPFIKITAF